MVLMVMPGLHSINANDQLANIRLSAAATMPVASLAAATGCLWRHKPESLAAALVPAETRRPLPAQRLAPQT
jgi:hypothetical protein